MNQSVLQNNFPHMDTFFSLLYVDSYLCVKLWSWSVFWMIFIHLLSTGLKNGCNDLYKLPTIQKGL